MNVRAWARFKNLEYPDPGREVGDHGVAVYLFGRRGRRIESSVGWSVCVRSWSKSLFAAMHEKCELLSWMKLDHSFSYYCPRELLWNSGQVDRQGYHHFVVCAVSESRGRTCFRLAGGVQKSREIKSISDFQLLLHKMQIRNFHWIHFKKLLLKSSSATCTTFLQREKFQTFQTGPVSLCCIVHAHPLISSRLIFT